MCGKDMHTGHARAANVARMLCDCYVTVTLRLREVGLRPAPRFDVFRQPHVYPDHYVLYKGHQDHTRASVDCIFLPT